MDPKGDRLRKIKSGQLKLPESVLKSNNIVLTTVKPVPGGGCLEGGPRPRPIAAEEEPVLAAPRVPIIIPLKTNSKMTVSTAEIPLPVNAEIPLPEAVDIPLPNIDMGNIPLPGGNVSWNKHEDIPLPSNDSIPLPAEKLVTPHSEQRRRIKVSLSHLEPKGDELLCRSCVMKFSKQIDYDIHLQSEAHQQAIKQSDIQSHGASLLTKRLDKSPSHDNKSGHVSFSFKKNYGSRIVNAQPFVQARREEKRSSPVEIKLLKPEADSTKSADVTEEKTENGSKTEGYESGERDDNKVESDEEVPDKLLMIDFVKVQSKDDTGRVLDWPKEMIQYTNTEPRLMFSCNPLSFDFSQLFASKKKTVVLAGQDIGKEKVEIELGEKTGDELKTGETQKADSEKKKSHKKKKKKHKHKKDKVKDKNEKENENTENVNTKGESEVNSKKKKKKHKKKTENKENETVSNTETNDDKEKKKHKKSKKKSKQSEDEGEKGETVEERKLKKRKKKKSKKRKKKHHGDSENEKSEGEKENKDKDKGDSIESGKESEGEKKDKETKKKRKKRKKHKKKESENNESSESDTEKAETVKTEDTEKSEAPTVGKRKFPEADSDGESEKIVAKLQALNRTKVVQKQTVVSNQTLQKKIKKEPDENVERKTPSERKRINSESSLHESTPVKKSKVTPKSSVLKDNISVAAIAATVINNIKVEKEESWSKIETQTDDNVKSKWDTSESDMDNALDDTVKKGKVLRKHTSTRGAINKSNILKELKNPSGKPGAKSVTDNRKLLNQNSSQRSNKSNLSAGSAKILNALHEKTRRKSRKVSESPASSHSRSRSRSYSHRRSYSRSVSSSRSRSRSYSSSSYYSDDSYHSRHRRSRRSSSRSYSRSSSRSRSRSYRRRRGRSSSYSDYSRSRSYSTSRSRSRSQRRRKRSYSRSRSRSYSSSSYSSRSRSRTRSYRKSRRKTRRKKMTPKDRSLSVPPVQKDTVSKKKSDKEDKEKLKEEKEKVDPSEIPLPDLSGKKDDERTEEILQKLKEKKPRTDVGETVAKLVESLPADIPLPFSEGASKTISSDSLPSGPPSEAPKESDSGFIGPKMPGPPPPPPNMGQRFPPNHGPPGPPRPGYMHGQWDHWDALGHWDGPVPWDGPRPSFRGMRPPYDHRMYSPYDPRRRGPPPYMNRMRGPHPYMGPRYPGPHGPHPDYGYDYGEYDYAEDETTKSNSPPPLPKDPPKESSPKPPLPKKKGKEQTEPEQNPDIVIPPEQAEQYKLLQKQAAKHARRQMRRQAKKELGEPDEDSTSSESEPEEQPEQQVEETVVDETQAQLVAVPQQVVLQPQPAASPSAAYIIVSGGQQYIVQKPQVVQAGVPIQAGQPVVAVSQGTIMATAAAAAAGAHPAHVVQQVPIGHHQIMAAPTALSAGVPVAMASAASLQHLQQVQQLQQLQQIQHIQQIQQAQAIQAHNQAVAAAAVQQGPIVVGNRILIPTIGVRPAI